MPAVLDVATGAVAALAGSAATAYVWLPREKPRLRTVRHGTEVVLELSLLILLGLAVLTFSDDTGEFRRRVRAGVAVMYVASLFSVLAFGFILTAMACRGREDPSVQNLALRLSQASWALFIVTSLAAFIAYLTVEQETDSAKAGAGQNIVYGLMWPAVISILVIMLHCLCSCANCCCRKGKKWYTWVDTSAYHELTNKIAVTVVAAILIIAPMSLAASSPTTEATADEISTKDALTFLVDIVAAMIHRLNLGHFQADRNARVEAQKARDKAMSEAVCGGASSPVPPLPTPATYAAAPPVAPRPFAAPHVAAPPAAAPPVPLYPPAGWASAASADGRTYYYNASTGETRWSPPGNAAHAAAARASPPPAPSAPHVPVLPPGWVAYRAPDGRPYYFHVQTGQTAWERPVGAGGNPSG